MSNRLLVPRKTPGLLDLVPGAAAAYSLRSLSRSYADPVVTVRRSSDDAEENFTAAEVADGTLAAFCGAGDGFVFRWWDQTSNGWHATAAADANEPKIVSGGVVVETDGNPAIRFDGTSDYLLASSVSVSQPNTYFIVAKRDALTGKQNFIDGNSGLTRQEIAISASTGQRAAYASGGSSVSGTAANTAQELCSVIFNGSSSVFFVNGALDASGTLGAGAIGQLVIGADSDRSDYLEGTMQELILYPSDLSSQRELVEGLIAWGYSV